MPRLSPFVVTASIPSSTSYVMCCFFVRDGKIVDFEMLPPGLSDEDAIGLAHVLFSGRRGPFDGFEVWDGARLVFKHSKPLRTGQPRPL